MSPIEVKLYEALRQDGLSPIPQFRIEGYIVDFAFPDVRLAIEADGREYHSGNRRDRDHKRDWILGRQGWTVKRFYGTTIHQRAGNCSFVIKREVEARRAQAQVRARLVEIERQEQRDALLRPFQGLIKFLTRSKKGEGKREGV